MSLQKELEMPCPFSYQSHEAMLNIVLTGTLLLREGTSLLRPFGMTETHFNILMLLKYQSEEGKINQTRLGNMLLIHRSNITGIIDRMEKAGFVKRLPDPEDRRINYIEMTEKGKETLDNADRVYHKRLDEIMSALSESDNQKIIKLLEIIRKQLWNENMVENKS
ncbi:MarR family winged helix-turn-helix transcriptional regulator [Candidatus Latescibacterota bacterium]